MQKASQSCAELYEALKNPNGTINSSRVSELIRKYVELQNNAEQVYSRVTHGLLKGSHYSADTVISVFETTQKDLVNKNEVCDDMTHLVSDEGTKQLILEYFGKLY